MKIYTKGGDKGHTSLIGGKRVPKNNPRIEAYGTADELISYIGLLRQMIKNKHYQDFLLKVQDRLMVASSLLAADCEGCEKELPLLKVKDIELLEKEIDRMETKLPPLTKFILPGGNKTVAFCHICRTICRRVERQCVGLANDENIDERIIEYLNRLSDFLFVLARFISMETNAEEIPWTPEL